MNEVAPENPDVYAVLRVWEEEYSDPNYDPIPMLSALAELIETEAEEYMKKDPDPFDERHPSRAFPNCSLGHTLKVLFRKEAFMTKLVNDYLRDNYYQRLGVSGRDVRQLNIAACRLMLDITPGLETNAVFELPASDALVHRLFSWAEKSIEPLQTYATGLLAAAMEVQEIAVAFREQNLKLVPLMLERLHTLQAEAVEERVQHNNSRPFAEFSKSDGDASSNRKERPKGNSFSFKSPLKMDLDESEENKDKPPTMNGYTEGVTDKVNRRPSTEGLMSPPHTPSGPISVASARQTPYNMSDCSNSSWAEMEAFVIGTVQMHPLTLATRQLFILKYLTPMGEYQEFLSHVFEKNALVLILQFINLRETKHARLSFEALKYLASLLCHKKFSIEFISLNGLQRLLEVPRPSIAATGVSICLYYLAYCEDAVERVCVLPQPVLSDLVRYALWLLECSHDSGRCHATMFFGLTFQFRVILEEFDKQDGLRKLYNVICTLPILRIEDAPVNEDEECSARQIVRHVCVALKRYLEAHLSLRAEQVRRAHLARDSSGTSHSLAGQSSKIGTAVPGYKACKSGPEEVREEMNTLLALMSFRASWPPVDNLIRLGGLTLLLQVIAFAYEWNNSGRAETVRCALDVLGICAVMPRAQVQLCEKVDLPDETNTVGINVILKAAEGEIVSDPDVQRAALHVIITCVCAPIVRVGSVTQRPSTSTPVSSNLSGGSARKRVHVVRSSEEIIEKMWECLRKTNGIMVLLALIQKRLPLTDSDSIRSLACQALAGLARSETVRQIISKLPLFTSGSLQILMKNPILPDRRQDHVLFQKYALELLERVSGKSKPRNELEPSLANIHRANVIAQTRITYNQRELFQLIQLHLAAHGMSESAEVLAKEANLPPIKPANSIGFVSSAPPFLSPFTYELAQASCRSGGRASLKAAPSQDTLLQTPSSLATGPILLGQSPIRLNINSPGQRKLNHEMKLKCDTPRADQSPATQALIARLEKRDSFREPIEPRTVAPPAITLDTIVTEYLMNQHSLCKNPMATCPQFTLLEHHKCPDPKSRVRLPNNTALRQARGTVSRRLDQRFIHSRFACVHIFRFGDENTFFTCCDFFKNDRHIAIGSHQGDVKLFNVQTGSEVGSHHCHESVVSNLACARTKPLMLTSSLWRAPLSTCWKITDNVFTPVLSMDEEDYVEFNKLTEDRIIGTKGETATIYDVETKALLQTLKPTMSNLYTKNRATFSPTNELVLSDGVLWDVNSGKEIHKFDKLNQTLSGVFHPNGLEIISNTEVWDLRTFHLLRTVPELDHCDVLFSPAGYTLYCLTADHDAEEENQFQNSFKTLDAYDYSCIATIDVKKYIYDLACNGKDTQIALVENQRDFGSVEESIVKIYDVGRSRSTDDEVEEDDEDEEESMEASDGSGSDDDVHDESMALDELLQLQSDDDDSNSSSSFSSSSNRSDQGGDDDNNDDDDDDDNGDHRMNGDVLDGSSDDSDSIQSFRGFGDPFFM